MVSLKKSGTNLQYKCATVPGLGVCHPVVGEQATVKDPISNMDFLKLTPIKCEKDEALQSVEGETSGDDWYRYRQMCCMASGLPFAIVPQRTFARDTYASWEGLYCPSERDKSGRSIFTMLTKFSEKWVIINEALVIQCEDTKKGFYGGRQGTTAKYGDITADGLAAVWSIQKRSGTGK